MKKLLNTLYITNPDIKLGRDGLTIVAWIEDKKVSQFPIHNFRDIICFNYTGVSSGLLELCAEKGISITFLSRTGRFRGKFYGPVKGNVLLRKEQYRISEDKEESLIYSKIFILAKIQNSIRVLDRFIREHPDHKRIEEIRDSKNKLKESKENAVNVKNSEQLLGIEGDASREYFSVFDHLILKNKDIFEFKGRSRRPPLDRVNALLSLSYSFIRVRVESALESVGLDPYIGYYHRDRSGRCSLALDLMEELRAYMGDRFVLTLINNAQIDKKDFYVKENGAILFTDDGFKKFIDLWNQRMQEKITHPFLEDTINIGLIPYCQAMLLARNMREDLELYPPFLII